MCLAIRYQENLEQAFRRHGLGLPEVHGTAGTVFATESFVEKKKAKLGSIPSGSFPMPRDHFHGPTFHALLHDHRVRHVKFPRRLPAENVPPSPPAAQGNDAVKVEGRAPTTAAKDRVDTERNSVGGGDGDFGDGLGNNAPNNGAGNGLGNGHVTGHVAGPYNGAANGIRDVESQHRPGNGLHNGIENGLQNGFGSSVTSALPIDGRREEIVEHVRANRITVIHGETGCGKSSRVPVMLAEAERERGGKASIFVSQPRRAATVALFRRINGQQGKKNKVT